MATFGATLLDQRWLVPRMAIQARSAHAQIKNIPLASSRPSMRPTQRHFDVSSVFLCGLGVLCGLKLGTEMRECVFKVSLGWDSALHVSEGQMSNMYGSPGDHDPRSEAWGQRERVVAGEVKGPAIALMIAAGLSILTALYLFGVALKGALDPDLSATVEDEQDAAISFAFTLVTSCFFSAVASFVLFGAIQMFRLKNHRLAQVASIVAMIPCISPCCVLSLPFGLWSILVLNKTDVRRAFKS